MGNKLKSNFPKENKSYDFKLKRRLFTQIKAPIHVILTSFQLSFDDFEIKKQLEIIKVFFYLKEMRLLI